MGGEVGWVGSQMQVIPYNGIKSSHYVVIEAHKQPQITCQAETVAYRSLTPSVALLVHPRGTVYSIVNCHEFTTSQHDASESRPVALSLVSLDSARVEYDFHVKLSVLAGLFRVFANPAMYVHARICKYIHTYIHTVHTDIRT